MVNVIGLVITAIITAIVAAIGLSMANTILVHFGIGNVESGAYGSVVGTQPLGLWSLLPLLFPFIVVAIILIGIYATFKGYGD